MVKDVHLLLLLLLLFNQFYYLTHQDDIKLHCIKTAAPCIWQKKSMSLFTLTYRNNSTVLTPTSVYS